MRGQVQGRERFPGSGHGRKPGAEVGVYMWGLQSPVDATMQGRGLRTHVHRGSLSSWALVSPEVEQMAEPPQRGREPFPLPLGPWEGSARLPLTYQPALSFSSSPFPQHSQAFSWYHTGCSASLHEARTSSD